MVLPKKLILTLLVVLLNLFSSNVSFANGVIDRNSNGDEIVYLQQSLESLGYFLMVDGIFGPQTQGAVSSFQQNNGLPVTGIVDEATLIVIKRAAPSISRYSRSMIMEATGYSRFDPGCGDYTANGNYLRKGLVAVDPNVIPLGTRLYIPGYGMAIADDTGGAIKGRKIDLAFESREDALSFGRRSIVVYILG